MDDMMDIIEMAEHLCALQGEGRRVVALAGAPGAGKSTLAESLRERINGTSTTTAEILPMDGFHYDDHLLDARGDRTRKGAPHTFDVDGLVAILDRLRADDGRSIAVPVFDRDLEIARAGARIIDPTARLIIVEGNYLLLDDLRWAELRPRFDLTIMLRVPEHVLRSRLESRWQGYGLPPEPVAQKLDDNDMPNVSLVLDQSVAADFEIAL